jgi:soluble lytic murein transglycosylase-like protein
MGEVGLMGVRLATAMMLGFRGDQAELFDPALNATYGVAHLAQAWRIAGGDVCRTLVKYRSHYGEERSARFPGACANLGRTLAAMNSPLAGQTALAQAPAADEARRAAEARRVHEAKKADAKPEEAKPAPAAQAAEPAGEAKPVETAPVAEAKPAPPPVAAEIKAAPTVDAPVAVAVAHPAPPARPAVLAALAPLAKSRTVAKPRSKPEAETGSAKAKTDKPTVMTTGSTKGVTLVAKTRSGGSGKTALTCTAKNCTLERGPKN